MPKHGKRDAQAPSLTRFRRGGGWGVRYPKAPSRIAREGFLTEGVSPPTTPPGNPSAGPARTQGPAHRERQRSPGRRRSRGLGRGLSAKPPGQRRALAIGAVSKGTARAALGGNVRLLLSSTGISREKVKS